MKVDGMIIIAYDISNNKVRTKFSKYLSKFGHRLQYSIFEIDNGDRILNNIVLEINNKFMPLFTQDDSVFIFRLSKTCKIEKYGFAKNEDFDIIVL